MPTSPRILLLTPPLTQLNTPYPATAYLKGFLGGRGYRVRQADLSLGLVLRLFSAAGLRRVFDAIEQGGYELSDNARRMLRLRGRYESTIGPAVRFLQNKDLTLAARICYGHFLPEAGRFDQVGELQDFFGSLGQTDQARHLATLYLEDLADLVRETVGPQFGLSRYAEKLALSATHFDALHEALQAPPNLVDTMLLELLDEELAREKFDLVGLTVPFPGNLYGALRLAQRVKEVSPGTLTLMGGGYPNTELRSLREPRFFDYVDYLTLDDGEGPWLRILDSVASCSLSVVSKGVAAGMRSLTTDNEQLITNLQRTFLRNVAGEVEYVNHPGPDVPHTEVGTPDYSDLPLGDYLSVIEVLNPMHRLWSDGRWNKLTVAHGCYWKRCSFCDVTLDYIARYETAPATLLVDRIEQIVAQTGQTGFHFVDEAAPPLALRDLALELLRRRVSISWWGNIRFEKTFTPDLCRLLAASGCIAVSGGLEVASDRLLALMEKGVTVAQVARVAQGFTQAGILVHAYLMYGFPTQTAQETVDALEVVRQLFAAGVVQSGYWHRFSMTAHSPVGKNPAKYGVEATGPAPGPFAWNDLWHADPQGADHEAFGPGLAKSLYNFMHGVLVDAPVNSWFDFRTPKTSLPRPLIQQALAEPPRPDAAQPGKRLVWLGHPPELRQETSRKGPRAVLTCYEPAEDFELKTHPAAGPWLADLLTRLSGHAGPPLLLREAATSFPAAAGSFEAFAQTPAWRTLREKGLLLV